MTTSDADMRELAEKAKRAHLYAVVEKAVLLSLLEENERLRGVLAPLREAYDRALGHDQAAAYYAFMKGNDALWKTVAALLEQKA